MLKLNVDRQEVVFLCFLNSDRAEYSPGGEASCCWGPVLVVTDWSHSFVQFINSLTSSDSLGLPGWGFGRWRWSYWPVQSSVLCCTVASSLEQRWTKSSRGKCFLTFLEGVDAQSMKVYVPSDSWSILSCTFITLRVLTVQRDLRSLF